MSLLEALPPQTLQPPNPSKPELHEVVTSFEQEAIRAIGQNHDLLSGDQAAAAIATALSSGRLRVIPAIEQGWSEVEAERALIRLSILGNRTIEQAQQAFGAQ